MSVKTHELKTWPAVFQAIVDGSKTFEFRKNDRGFQSGDSVVLNEWNPETSKYTGKSETFKIGYVAIGAFGIPDGYCVFSLIPPTLRTRLQQVESERDKSEADAAVMREALDEISNRQPSDGVGFAVLCGRYENIAKEALQNLKGQNT